jgi:hypothetical protein
VIRGRFAFVGGLIAPVPVIRATVHITSEPLTSRITFIVDTGSERTTLHPRDAAEVWPGYPSQRFPPDVRRVRVRGIGGEAHYVERDAALRFVHDVRGRVSVELPINIAEPTPANLGLPSLLDRDVIRHFRLTIDESAEFVSLELTAPAG